LARTVSTTSARILHKAWSCRVALSGESNRSSDCGGRRSCASATDLQSVWCGRLTCTNVVRQRTSARIRHRHSRSIQVTQDSTLGALGGRPQIGRAASDAETCAWLARSRALRRTRAVARRPRSDRLCRTGAVLDGAFRSRAQVRLPVGRRADDQGQGSRAHSKPGMGHPGASQDPGRPVQTKTPA